MNQQDRDKLDFLLSASPEVIKDWYEKMDADDILYAFELLEQAGAELVEVQLEGSDFSDAKTILSKFIKE